MTEFEDQARRLLRRLGGRATLKRRGAAYLIFGVRGARTPWPPALIDDMAARGWLREQDGALVLTEAGAQWRDEVPFADRHRILDTRLLKDDRGRECYVVENVAESPLTLLHQRGLITAIQLEAGEKLRRDFTIAQLTPRMGVDYDAPVGPRGYRPNDIAEIALAARQRFNLAMRAAGPGLSDVLFDVCCYLKGLEDSEKARNWPRSSAKIVLRIALDRLAGHYGMGAARHARMRSWNLEEEEKP